MKKCTAILFLVFGMIAIQGCQSSNWAVFEEGQFVDHKQASTFEYGAIKSDVLLRHFGRPSHIMKFKGGATEWHYDYTYIPRIEAKVLGKPVNETTVFVVKSDGVVERFYIMERATKTGNKAIDKRFNLH